MMFALLGRDNATTAGGYTSNGVTIQENITARGSSFCLVVCAVMGVTCLVNLGLSYLKPSTERVFFHIVAVINFTAFIVYYTMGSNLGWTPVNVGTVQPSSPDGTYRSVFYIRYIDWAITTPLVVVNLLLTAGMPLSTIVYVMFWDEVMVVSGLGGALTSTRYKFGFFAIGCVAMLYVFYHFAFVGRKQAYALGNDIGRIYTVCGIFTAAVWVIYPIVWGLSEGSNVIGPDSEAISYGILDLLAKPVFSAVFIYSHWYVGPSRVGLRARESGALIGKMRSEKHASMYPYSSHRPIIKNNNGGHNNRYVVTDPRCLGLYTERRVDHTPRLDNRTRKAPLQSHNIV